MDLDLKAVSCAELNISAEVSITTAFRDKLISQQDMEKQIDEQEVFFHRDYVSSNVKHHCYATIEWKRARRLNAVVNLSYVVVTSRKLFQTAFTPSYLFQELCRALPLEVVTWRCQCEFEVSRKRVDDQVSSYLPLRITGENATVTMKAVQGEVKEKGERVYEVLLEAVGKRTFKLTFGFTYEAPPSEKLATQVLEESKRLLELYVKGSR